MWHNVKCCFYTCWKRWEAEKTILIPFSNQHHQKRSFLMSGGNVCFSFKRDSGPPVLCGFPSHIMQFAAHRQGDQLSWTAQNWGSPSTGTFSAKTRAVGDPLHSPGVARKLATTLSLFSKHRYLPQICPHPAHLELQLEHLSPPEVNALSQLLTDPANPCGL